VQLIALYLDIFTSARSHYNKQFQRTIKTLCGLRPKDIITQWELNLKRKIIFIPIYLTFRPVVNFYQFDFEIVYVIMLL
jgi:hypothetical protein